MSKQHILFLSLTYLSFLSDWACSIETNRLFYPKVKEILNNSETHNTYLQQELTCFIRNNDTNYNFIFEELNEMYQLEMPIADRVLEKFEKDCFSCKNYDLREEFKYSDSPLSFLFHYIGRKLSNEQYELWYNIADYYQVDLQ